MTEWLNTPSPYAQYTYDADPRLKQIILMYGFAFDDSFWYWIPRARRGELRTDIVKRSPLWTYPNKSVPAEKSSRKKAAHYFGQKCLLPEVLT